MLKEVIVVEGKKDIAAVERALAADTLATGGLALSAASLAAIQAAYERRGIIILTDSDTAGARIRRYLAARFPLARHAYIAKDLSTRDGRVGVEKAAPAAIRAALAQVRPNELTAEATFTLADLVEHGLAARASAASRRSRLAALLGLGYGNAKTILKRLNGYGVTRAEFLAACAQLEQA